VKKVRAVSPDIRLPSLKRLLEIDAEEERKALQRRIALENTKEQERAKRIIAARQGISPQAKGN
jgi:hypothetical protein